MVVVPVEVLEGKGIFHLAPAVLSLESFVSVLEGCSQGQWVVAAHGLCVYVCVCVRVRLWEGNVW